MDLKKMTEPQLRQWRAKVDAELVRRGDQARRQALSKLKKIAAGAGFKLEDLVGGRPAAAAKAPMLAKAGAPKPKRSSPARGKKIAPKYIHPENATLTWTGRGRQPKWVAEWLAGGRTLAEVAVK